MCSCCSISWSGCFVARLLAHLLEFFGLGLHVVLHLLELLGSARRPSAASAARLASWAAINGGLGARGALPAVGAGVAPLRALELSSAALSGARHSRRLTASGRINACSVEGLDAGRAPPPRHSPAPGGTSTLAGASGTPRPCGVAEVRMAPFVHRVVVMLQQAAVAAVVLVLNRERPARDVHCADMRLRRGPRSTGRS